MKELFPAYFALAPEEIDKVWDSGIISFDTNVFNNLYRGELDIFHKFEQLVSKIEARVWVPYQVGVEVAGSIAREHKALKDYGDKLQQSISTVKNQLIAEIQKERPSLFRDKSIPEVVEKSFAEILTSAKRALKDVDLDTHLKTVDKFLTQFLDGRISSPPSSAELEALFQRGRQRYELRIPPGYEDMDKSTGNMYGDYLIWQSLLNQCRDRQSHCIFVTDDTKKDWWKNYSTGTPHPRLVQEFYEYTGHHYLQYPTTQFLDEVARRFKLPPPSAKMKQRIKALAFPSESVAVAQLYQELQDASESTDWSWKPNARLGNVRFDLYEPKVKLAVEIEGVAYLYHAQSARRRATTIQTLAEAHNAQVVFVSLEDTLRKPGTSSTAFKKIYDAYLTRHAQTFRL